MMWLFQEKFQVALALINVCSFVVASYRPVLAVAHVAGMLGFEAQQEFVDWVTQKDMKLTFNPDGTKIDCKASMQALPNI